MSILAFAGACSHVEAQSATGDLDCSVMNNHAKSSGAMTVRQGKTQIATGTCGRPIKVPAGQYLVTVQLDSAMDRPTKILDAKVAVGEKAVVTADFRTATLQVNVAAQGTRGAILIALLRGKKRIGTLRNGAPHMLSAGMYSVSVEQSDERKTQSIELRPGQRRLVRVAL